jgi:hypothetical protein
VQYILLKLVELAMGLGVLLEIALDHLCKNQSTPNEGGVFALGNISPVDPTAQKEPSAPD